MRRLFDRVPLLWKYLLISVLVLLSFYVSFYLFSQRILSVLRDALNVQIPLSIFQGDFVWFFIWGALISVFLLMLMYFDLVHFLSRIDHHFDIRLLEKMIQVKGLNQRTYFKILLNMPIRCFPYLKTLIK